MRVYLAAPLFSVAERSFNERLAGRIEAEGFRVFLPQRDGVEGDRPPDDATPPDARRRAVFELDRAEILPSDIFLSVLDGRVPDEGACVELGIAHLKGARKLLVGLHTDARAAFPTSKLNPMVRVPPDEVAGSEEALISPLRDHRTKAAAGGTP